MRKNKIVIIILVMLLAIGFAAVSTTLILNGNLLVGTNPSDFDVYFSSAIIDAEDYSNEVISEDKLSISYTTKTLALKGDSSTLEYEVTNKSRNYDAEVNVTCTGSNEFVTITHTPEKQIIDATSIGEGEVVVTLNKTAVEEKVIGFTCTLNVNAVERTEAGENELLDPDTYVIYGNYVDENEIAIPNANLIIYSDIPHYVTTDENGYLLYNGLEKGSHEIYYVNDTLENIKLMTKEEVINMAVSSTEFTTSTIGELLFENNSKITNNEIITNKSYCKTIVGTTWEYNYTGASQNFMAPCDGSYKVELWGAQGGDYNQLGVGGKGGYVSGITNIDKYIDLYVYVGNREHKYNTESFNGSEGSGGGATDIRIIDGEWDEFASLKSRIIVAGGGGYLYNGLGSLQLGYGGGLSGSSGSNTTGGTQTTYGVNLNSSIHNGAFGKGGPGYGGGGGYYGGGGGFNSTSAGGSSFISGHLGCDAITESSTVDNIIHTGQANHYSGYVFTNTIMIDGAGYNWTNVKGSYVGMPTYNGVSIMVGNTGNGYAKITLISTD